MFYIIFYTSLTHQSSGSPATASRNSSGASTISLAGCYLVTYDYEYVVVLIITTVRTRPRQIADVEIATRAPREARGLTARAPSGQPAHTQLQRSLKSDPQTQASPPAAAPQGFGRGDAAARAPETVQISRGASRPEGGRVMGGSRNTRLGTNPSVRVASRTSHTHTL